MRRSIAESVRDSAIRAVDDTRTARMLYPWDGFFVLIELGVRLTVFGEKALVVGLAGLTYRVHGLGHNAFGRVACRTTEDLMSFGFFFMLEVLDGFVNLLRWMRERVGS